MSLFNQDFLQHSWPSINRVPAFSPLDLTNLHAWYDATDLSSITKDGSDRVSQWNDKSGNGHHLTQATGGNQPLWVDDGQNSKDIINFTGSRWMDVSFTALTYPVTIFYVGLLPADSGSDSHMYDADTSLKAGHYLSGTADRFIMYAGTSSIEFTQTGYDGTWRYNTTIWNDTASKMRFDGVEKASGTASVLSLDGFTVSSRGTAGFYGNGKFMHIAIMDALASAQEISDMEAFMKTEAGL